MELILLLDKGLVQLLRLCWLVLMMVLMTVDDSRGKLMTVGRS